jgi:tripartite-type tricarboxylate transporter receptor subunit TctC
VNDILKWGIGLLLCAAASLAQAQQYPSKPVRIIVPVPPGSGIDTMTRGLAQRLSASWGQPVVIENQPGANSLIGTAAAAKAAPDGYTLLVAPDGTLTVNPHLYDKLPYDPVKDLAPITLLVTFNQMLLANPGLPVANVAELVQHAKANSGKLTYASYGLGSQPHLLGEMLKHAAGIEMVHVPYKGAPQAVLSTLSGETQLTWASPFTVAGHVRAGKLKPLALAAPARSSVLPDVPTFREAGLPAVEWQLWVGLFAPAGTASAIIQRVHADVSKLLADPEIRDKELQSKGYDPNGMGPEQFAALIQREIAIRGALVKRIGVKAE